MSRGRGGTARFVKSTREKTAVNEGTLNIEATAIMQRFENASKIDAIDETMGFPRYESGPRKIGWLVNMHPAIISSDQVKGGQSAVDYYFLDEEGGSFKATLEFDPYFLLSVKEGHEVEVEEYLRRKFEKIVKNVSRKIKEDLSVPNHLLGIRRRVVQVNFNNVSDLLAVRRELMPVIASNKAKKDTVESYAEISLSTLAHDKDWAESDTRSAGHKEALDFIEEIHEYDVPYHVRVAIDKGIRIGKWYTVEASQGRVSLTVIPERVARADPVVMAYDIETTKDPLKFPDSSKDRIMMISYMIDGEGYLITNREIVSEDIDDFEYTPKPEYPGTFTIFNEPDEKALILRFFDHIKEEKPTVIATFNGDFFDWPFVDNRARIHGIDMFQEIGFAKDSEDEYKSAHCAHMDAFRWVKRDSYLPQGSQGLKAVTTAKLGYNPLEIDPELMTAYAMDKPQVMAEYSVSDAVATYYLYMKYVHPFIFSLCNIIPLNPDEVLRKGTGTLCEMLLMVQAYEGGILLPNKHADPLERFYNGHLLESETYVGGHVESLEAGVFRSDIPAKFAIDTTAVDELLEQLERALKFSIEVEGQKKMEDVTNYDEVKVKIEQMLLDLKCEPIRDETPLIYHVDVASMYPNIMTTNRLQPDSMITEEDCASCDFNRPGKTCDRRLPWSWRGEFLPAKREEYLMIRNSLRNERFPGRGFGAHKNDRSFDDLSSSEQAAHIKKRLTEYSRKVYHKIKETETIEREAIICQRENPFYVNTVRDFRDRRYEFKGLQKVWKKKVDDIPASDAAGREEAKKMVVLYDSLQLAHKVILNSFYGYVMRKGSRWYSMEMAGVTCLTGATIIQLARSLVERLGRPLELDTDGIWCILPKSFPEDFVFKLKDGKKLPVSYPCVMLNHLVHEKFTNHQYQTLVDKRQFRYETMSDNSIFFEVDGPYKAMVLPTSKDEDKGLKKRYAVFNEDGSLAELKGFEIKRRGELQLIKTFQSQVFKEFLAGETLEECYQAVAHVANIWLDVLDTRGGKLQDDDMIQMISENRSMSRSLEEYGNQKSTSICTARRLAEFLGEGMVKDAGLACKYIISKKPEGAPVTERAVPVAIFSAPPSEKSYFLRRWLKDQSVDDFTPRAIIDWQYYKERLGATIQKIITVPAAYQGIKNPVPRLPHPEWLEKRIAAQSDKGKQKTVTSFFQTVSKEQGVLKDATNRANQMGNAHKVAADFEEFDSDVEMVNQNGELTDIEDYGVKSPTANPMARVTAKRRTSNKENENEIHKDAGLVQPSTLVAMPDPQEDYGLWLRAAKIKWTQQKQARQRRQHLFGDSTRARNSSLAGMIQNQNQNAYSNSWTILQYGLSDVPGQVRAFASINGKVQTVKINVPRTVFLNFKSENHPDAIIPGCTATRVNHTLPSGRVPVALYKLVMPEEAYQTEIHRPDSILHHHTVEGIYESQLSLDQRALLFLGKRCLLDTSTRTGLLGKGLEKGFELDWLTPQSGRDHFDLAYIHVVHIATAHVQAVGIFNTWNNHAEVLVLRPSAQAQKLPNLANVYAIEYARVESLTNDLFEYQSNLEFSEHYFDSANGMYRKLGAIVSRLHNEKNTKCVLALQTEHADRMKKMIRSLNEMPIVYLKPLTVMLPPLNWQQELAKWLSKTFLGLGKWLTHLIDLSQYSNVPLGNLKHDDPSYLTDVMYARRLQQSSIILWWSPEPMPDTGGWERDDLLVNMDKLDMPNVNNSGLYSKVCIDLSIRNLSVNTILTAAIINEAEGTDLAGEHGGDVPFIENSFSTPALSVLSSMVRDWWNEAAANNNFADMMVHNFIRWVSAPDSFLYDRKLYYHVQNLSKKAFVQLVKEFRKVGCQLVFADQNRALLVTSKSAVENTYAFANYMIKSIRSKPLFNYLDIEIREYWSMLLWMDDVNFGGESCQEIGEGELNMQVTMNWHIKKFLPEMLQVELETWIVEFLDRFKDAKEQWRHSQNEESEDHNRATQIGPTALARGNGDEEIEDYVGRDILRSIEPMILKRMKHLLKQYSESFSNADIQVEFQLPILAGSDPDTVNENPVARLIKSLCAIFSLSKDMTMEARLIRRHLLELVDVSEFEKDAAFKNPSASLKITQVICDHCKYVRDLDVCRNDDLAEQQQGYTTFACEDCGREYNRVALEERLVQQALEMITLYQAQDLKCGKCKRIREDEFAVHCECSGEWLETMPRSDIFRHMRIYNNVAQFCGLKLLEDMLTTVVIA